jgi:hypothetical protein
LRSGGWRRPDGDLQHPCLVRGVRRTGHALTVGAATDSAPVG